MRIRTAKSFIEEIAFLDGRLERLSTLNDYQNSCGTMITVCDDLEEIELNARKYRESLKKILRNAQPFLRGRLVRFNHYLLGEKKVLSNKITVMLT